MHINSNIIDVQAYGIDKFLLGSVADECSRHSRLPVVVVRNDHHPAAAQQSTPL
jgi:hypothetical protein